MVESSSDHEAALNRGRNFTNVYRDKEIGGFQVICSGRAVCPGAWAGSLFTWMLIVCPSVIQIVFVNSQFSNQFLIDFFYVLVMILSLGSLLMTTMTDPGVIPRGKNNSLLSPKDLGITIETASN